MLPMRRFIFDDDLFNFPERIPMPHMNMKTDIKDADDHYEMEVELPGVAKEDISLSLNDGYLTIEGVKNVKNETEDQGYVQKERFSGRVSRSYYVGNVSEDDIKASYVDGVLKVTFPKPQTKIPETKKILIE